MDFSFLSKTILFQGAAPDEIEQMLGCLGAESKMFEKGVRIYCAGDYTRLMGLVLHGGVNIENDNLWGNTTILGHISAGQIFAEAYACTAGEPLMVNVVASETTEVLFLNVERILQVCPSACPYHSKLVRNLLAVMAQKNLNLSQRIFYTSPKTIRGRLVSYLSDQAVRQGSCKITIPFNRQQLADYLGVDRSAMSNELGKMQRDGLLTVKKNKFELNERFRAQNL